MFYRHFKKGTIYEIKYITDTVKIGPLTYNLVTNITIHDCEDPNLILKLYFDPIYNDYKLEHPNLEEGTKVVIYQDVSNREKNWCRKYVDFFGTVKRDDYEGLRFIPIS